MGAAVRKPESKTKSGLSRLNAELRTENWTKHKAPAKEDREPGQGAAKQRSGAGSDDDDDDDDDLLAGDLSADYDITAGYASSSDEDIDYASEDKVARVRRLMETPLGDAGAGKRVPDREIRAMLSEAHIYSQRLGMLQFVEECRQRLDADDPVLEPSSSAGRRCVVFLLCSWLLCALSIPKLVLLSPPASYLRCFVEEPR